MKSPIKKRAHIIKEVSLPPLNFNSMATLRAMSNLVGGRVKEGSIVYILSKSFCLVNVLLVSFYLHHFFFYCVFCLAYNLKN